MARFAGRAESLKRGTIERGMLFDMGVRKLQHWLDSEAPMGLVYGEPGSGKTHLIRRYVGGAGIEVYDFDKTGGGYRLLDKPESTRVVAVDDVGYALNHARARELEGERGTVERVVEQLKGFYRQAQESGARLLLISTANMGDMASRIQEPQLQREFLGAFQELCLPDDVGALKKAGLGLPPVKSPIIYRSVEQNRPVAGIKTFRDRAALEWQVRRTFKMVDIPFLWHESWTPGKTPRYESAILRVGDLRHFPRWTKATVLDTKPIPLFSYIFTSRFEINEDFFPLASPRQLALARKRLGEEISSETVNQYLSNMNPVERERMGLPEGFKSWVFDREPSIRIYHPESNPMQVLRGVIHHIWQREVGSYHAFARALFGSGNDREAEEVLVSRALDQEHPAL